MSVRFSEESSVGCPGWVRKLAAMRAALLATLVATLSFPAFSASPAPDELVRVETQGLLELLHGGAERYADDREAFLGDVADRLSQFLDFPGISRLVMGKAWAQASEDQRDRFAEVFRSGLVGTYTGALMAFTDVEVEVEGARPGRSPRRASVQMRVRSGDGRDVPMVYSMALLDEGWRVRNVVIDGINLGLIYRNQFTNALQSREIAGDIDKVIDGWSAEIESLAEETSEPGSEEATAQSPETGDEAE